jgi:GH25 family lysozyme M1 (1,4-beta-N-acetylmuramidase)
MANIQGIDVSRWQGDIDWSKVAKAGIKFAILKVAGSDKGFYKDPKFEQNYKGAKANGIKVGAYYFVGKYCISANDGKADAIRCLRFIEGKKFDLPVFIDIETTDPSKKRGATDAVIAFCKEIEKAGYQSGVYASKSSGFAERLEDNRLNGIVRWVAQYNTTCTYKGTYAFWQKSSKGQVDGIKGNVDLDEWISRPLTAATTSAKVKKVTKAVVQAVIRGDYGNGDERTKRLTAAGYDAKAVQKAVNEALK